MAPQRRWQTPQPGGLGDADELEVDRPRMPERMVVGRIDTAENAVIDAMYRPVRVRLEGPQRTAGRAR